MTQNLRKPLRRSCWNAASMRSAFSSRWCRKARRASAHRCPPRIRANIWIARSRRSQPWGMNWACSRISTPLLEVRPWMAACSLAALDSLISDLVPTTRTIAQEKARLAPGFFVLLDCNYSATAAATGRGRRVGGRRSRGSGRAAAATRLRCRLVMATVMTHRVMLLGRRLLHRRRRRRGRFTLSVLPLYHELDATIALTASRGGVGVDRMIFAEAPDRGDAVGTDAVRGEVLVHDVRTTLGQPLVVLRGAHRVGVTVDFDLHLRIAVQRIHGLIEDGQRFGFRRLQGRADVVLALLRTVELEVHAAQVDHHILRATIRTQDRARRRIRALRRWRRRRRRSRRRRRRSVTHLDHETHGGKTIDPRGITAGTAELPVTWRGGETGQAR